MSKNYEETLEEKQIAYDRRSSCFVEMGSEYGVGKAQPVGKFRASNNSPIPQKAYHEDIYKKVQEEPKD